MFVHKSALLATQKKLFNVPNQEKKARSFSSDFNKVE